MAVPGARLYYRVVGSSTPLVVLHGGPDFNHNYLLPELDRLAGLVRLIYYDQRGRGKSSEGVMAADVTIDSEIDDLERLRQHLGLDTVALLGHSWGCVLAMEYATRYPDRTSHVVLMNSAPASHRDLLLFRGEREVAEVDSLSRMRAIAQTRAYLEGDLETEAEYYRAHFRRALRRPERVAEIVARLRTHFSPESIILARAIEDRLYDQTWQRPEYDLVRRLESFTKPLLVLHGEHDFVPLACSAHIAAASTTGRLVVLRECGHFAYLESPAALVEAIEGFLHS
jgi:proline iminopeptidase